MVHRTQPDSWHAVAFFRPDQGLIGFFDPNLGEYRVSDARYDEFFAKYETLLQEKAGLTPDLCWFAVVSGAPGART
jgi:hypothetical protein